MKTSDEIISCGSISLNRSTMTVMVSGSEVELNSKEYFLLDYLIRNKNMILTRKNILENVWSDNLDVNDRVVDSSIRRLRESLKGASRQIKTVIGRGYKLTEEQ